jgi:serine protease inhibitor
VKLLNGLFVDEEYFIQPAYRCDARDAYDARVGNIDFSKLEAAANEINTWITEHSGDRIDDDVMGEDALVDAKLVSVFRHSSLESGSIRF